jgi:uncharacterized protein YgiM (DUF1202 family)
MFNIKKAVAAVALSGAVLGGTATTAFASTSATSGAHTATAATQGMQLIGSWCGYQVFRAPNGLYVRTGPGTGYRVIGSLWNGQWTTGSCTKVRGWVHLSNKYNHWYSPRSARGWSYGGYLRSTAKVKPVYWCGYQVYRAPNGLYVRTGPSTMYRVIGGLANGQRTTGSCAMVRGWVHLSDKYNHYHSPRNARGWSYGHYLRR